VENDGLQEWSARKKYELPSCRLTLMLGNASNDIVWEKEIEVR
jgi:hypothetical protein